MADKALLQAALRHLAHAEHFADSANPLQSFDQAYHLAGFGPECVRKAALDLAWVNTVLGHEMGSVADDVLKVVLDLHPSTARYDLREWEKGYPTLAKWSPNCRYEANGTRKQRDVDSLLKEAWDVVSEIIAALWADGRIEMSHPPC